MADFIEQLPDGEARVKLTSTLQHSHPFRRFKDMLLTYPAVREQWFTFHEQALVELARQWLDDAGIEANLKLRDSSKG